MGQDPPISPTETQTVAAQGGYFDEGTNVYDDGDFGTRALLQDTSTTNVYKSRTYAEGPYQNVDGYRYYVEELDTTCTFNSIELELANGDYVGRDDSPVFDQWVEISLPSIVQTVTGFRLGLQSDDGGSRRLYVTEVQPHISDMPSHKHPV